MGAAAISIMPDGWPVGESRVFGHRVRVHASFPIMTVWVAAGGCGVPTVVFPGVGDPGLIDRSACAYRPFRRAA